MANRSTRFKQDKLLTCSNCGNANVATANFCGNCGQKLSKTLPCISSKFSGQFKKKLRVASGAVFAFSCLITCMFLYFSNGQKPVEKFFSDIPVDHQVYFECRKLLEMDGCRPVSTGVLRPEDQISATDLETAMLAVLRFYGQESHINVEQKDISPATISKCLDKLAKRFDREQALSLVPAARFDDMSRINVWTIIEQVFFNEENIL